MRRKPILLGAMAVVMVIAVIVHHTLPGGGKKRIVIPEPNKPQPDPMPIKQVVLFNSGVGYFQREGTVNGSGNVELTFATSDINDLLKSLVLEDLGGGHVTAVSLDGAEPIHTTLGRLALDLSTNPSYSQIIQQIRGEEIEVSLTASKDSPAAKHAGKVIGIELKKENEKQTSEWVNLLGKDGLRSFAVKRIEKIRFLDDNLQQEFQRALQLLARSHHIQQKNVNLNFTGAGQRKVRMGYVVEQPMWRMSYRLRLGDDGKLSLQGWGLVENTTDSDWDDVRMVLVSGRPISFKMNLHQPIYIPRPTVDLKHLAFLRPTTYDPTLDPSMYPTNFGNNMVTFSGNFNPNGGFNFGNGAFNPSANINGFNPGFNIGGGFQFGGGGFNFVGGGMQGAPPPVGQGGIADDQQGDNNANPQKGKNKKLTFEELQMRREAMKNAKAQASKLGKAITGLNFKAGIESVANSVEVGDYYQYQVEDKVTLPQHTTAMLPLFSEDIEGQKLSIYNAQVHKTHPLLGLRFKNKSDHVLTPGPVTVFDDNNYAGDSRIVDFQPGEEALLSYALDLGMSVSKKTEQRSKPSMWLQIDTDRLTARYMLQDVTTYLIKNRTNKDRTVIIEHPVREGWKLVDPKKPRERTKKVYRFEMVVKKGESATMDVVEEQPETTNVSLHHDGNKAPFFRIRPGIAVKPVVTKKSPEMVSIKIDDKVVAATYKNFEDRKYYVQNQTKEQYAFTIDHVIRKGWTVTNAPKKEDVSGQAFRMKLDVPSEKTIPVEVKEQQLVKDQLWPDHVYVEDNHFGLTLKLTCKQIPTELLSLEIQKGRLYSLEKHKEERFFYFQNLTDAKMSFNVQYVRRPEWTLLDEKGKPQKKGSLHEFQVNLPAKTVRKHDVMEERTELDKSKTLDTLTTRDLRSLEKNPNISPAVRKGITRTLELQKAHDDLFQSEREKRTELETVMKNQDRLRDNLKVIPMNNESYKTFLSKFVKQELRIETLQEELKTLYQRIARARLDLDLHTLHFSAK